jgi:peptidoglycan/xylan/chitin deacetylase (PgdA/CDA1 family)
MAIKIPILMYHSVVGTPNGDLSPPGYWISADRFADHLMYFKERGISPITLSELLRAREGRALLPGKPIVLTFDDGYLNNFTEVLPRLLDFGFTASFFITVSALGRPGMMGEAEIRTLRSEGMEVGSHGMRHELLARKQPGRLVWELAESKRSLASALGSEVDFFSLPRGYLPRGFARRARETGYRGMCTSSFGYNTLQTDPFRWRRLTVRTGCARRHLEALVEKEGALALPIHLAERFKSLLRRRYGWGRRESAAEPNGEGGIGKQKAMGQ